MRFASWKRQKEGFTPHPVGEMGHAVHSYHRNSKPASMQLQSSHVNRSRHSHQLPSLIPKRQGTHGAAGCQHAEDGGVCPEPLGQQEPAGAGALLALQQHLEHAPCTAALSPTVPSTLQLPQGQHQVILKHGREILQQGNHLGKQHQDLVRPKRRGQRDGSTENTKTNKTLFKFTL